MYKPYHLHQLLSVLALANITCGASDLNVLAAEQGHCLVHVGLPSAAHDHMHAPLTQSLCCGQADSGKMRCVEGFPLLHT